MNAERLNNWLTLLANIGVVVGLVVVIFEVRESNLQAKSAATLARYSEIETANRDFALSEYLPAIYVLVEETGVESLDAEQFSRIKSWEQSRILRMESQFMQYRAGYLAEPNFQVMVNVARELAPLWNELGVKSRNAEFLQAVGNDVDK